MGAYTYSGTAASNTTIDGIGAAGSDSPDNVDNLIRALAAADANFVKDLGGYNTVGGSADAITVTPADASTITNYTEKLIGFVAASDNATTSPTLNVDAVGAEPIKKAVQGVETALIAGDIQAGAYCLVRWRSTWDSGGGAWELINPALESQIELGHATDTTLTRSAAGVMAIEGGAGSLYAATIELGAASDTTLARSAAGVVTVEGVQLQRVSYPSATSASGTTVTLSGIPSWAKEIDIMVYAVSFNGTDNLLVQLGDSGGLEASGYNGTLYGAWDAVGGTTIASAGSTVMAVSVSAANRFLTGIMRLRLVGTNTWMMTFEGGLTDGSNYFFVQSLGYKALSDTLTQIALFGGGGGSYDGGTFVPVYRG